MCLRTCSKAPPPAAAAAAAAAAAFLDPLLLDAELSLESMEALSEKAESLSGLSILEEVVTAETPRPWGKRPPPTTGTE